jgi:hypothetical protein
MLGIAVPIHDAITTVMNGIGARRGCQPLAWNVHQAPPAADLRYTLAELSGSRFAPCGFDFCPRKRRAIRQAGHVGRTFGRSRSWPISLSSIRERRHLYASSDDASSDEGSATPAEGWEYAGRGYAAAATLPDLLMLALSTFRAFLIIGAIRGTGPRVNPGRGTSPFTLG